MSSEPKRAFTYENCVQSVASTQEYASHNILYGARAKISAACARMRIIDKITYAFHAVQKYTKAATIEWMHLHRMLWICVLNFLDHCLHCTEFLFADKFDTARSVRLDNSHCVLTS